MKKRMLFLLVLMVGLALACSLSGAPTAVGQPNQGGGNPLFPPNNPAPTNTLVPTPTPVPSKPIGFQEGLASLDAYIMTIDSNIHGPTSADSSLMHVDIKYSKAQNAKFVHYRTLTTSADSPDASPTETNSYTIGNITCSGGSDGKWDYSEVPLQSQEMMNLLTGLFDVALYTQNPTFVGLEAMNGVAANHFTFQVAGLGLQSGAQVTANQGNYWLAQDGQYTVKYTLVAETQDPATAQVLHTDVSIDLTSINQPVDITLPAECHP